MPDAEVQVDGLRKLQRALKQIDPELQAELKSGLKATAERVAGDARSRVPQKSGRAAASLRAGADTKGAYVAGGKASVPYYGWLDFGTRTAKSGQARTVGPWKGTGAGPARGRFIYPAIDANRDDIERDAARLMDDVAERLLPHDH
jgi:hypothetical protein